MISKELPVNILHWFGEWLREFLNEAGKTDLRDLSSGEDIQASLAAAILQAEIQNPWFVPEFQISSLKSWANILHRDSLLSWFDTYPFGSFFPSSPKRVGLILAGNIPLVGLHDVLSVLASGHIAVTKMSGKDSSLYPVLKRILEEYDPDFAQRWILTEGETLKELDAIIATGSDNSSRYFEYYFAKYPHIIRKNRNSIAILHGNETEQQLRELAHDIFLYFGLGCRNVSKIFVREDFKPDFIYRNILDYAYVGNHNKYANNYDYQRAVFLVNKVQFYDNGFLLLKEDTSISSPVGCLYFEKYSEPERLYSLLESKKSGIQCIVSTSGYPPGSIHPGKTQFPDLNDYADGIDTLNFLLNLS